MRPVRTIVAVCAVFGALVAAPAHALPPIKHVWVIVLENENFDTSFGKDSPATYLARELPPKGAFVPDYYGIGHQSLDNYVAMVSGQGPNPLTQADCIFYMDVIPGTIGANGQATGLGCVYPEAVKTIAGQLEAKGLTWHGYMEDMGNSTTQSRTCRHPALNSIDDTQSARVDDQYATRHNPFMYFHSVIDHPSCDANVVPLDPLANDLRRVSTTANFNFITPSLCHDGHDAPCVNGEPGGLVSADKFLRTWVPQIMASPAYRTDGLLVVTFDESGSGAASCCGEQSANTPNAGATTFGSGGGKVGAVLLSPFIKPGVTSKKAYNHYSFLRGYEDIFGLGHLGYAGANGLDAIGDDVFGGGPACFDTPLPEGFPKKLPPGSLITSATLRAGKLAFKMSRDARLEIGGSKKAPKRGRACRRYSVPTRKRSVTIVARRDGASERRVVHS